MRGVNENLSGALLTPPPAPPPRSPGVPPRAGLVPGPAPHPLACGIAATTTSTASTTATGTVSKACDIKAGRSSLLLFLRKHKSHGELQSLDDLLFTKHLLQSAIPSEKPRLDYTLHIQGESMSMHRCTHF